MSVNVCASVYTVCMHMRFTYLNKGISYKDKVYGTKPKLCEHQEHIHNESTRKRKGRQVIQIG